MSEAILEEVGMSREELEEMGLDFDDILRELQEMSEIDADLRKDLEAEFGSSANDIMYLIMMGHSVDSAIQAVVC